MRSSGYLEVNANFTLVMMGNPFCMVTITSSLHDASAHSLLSFTECALTYQRHKCCSCAARDTFRFSRWRPMKSKKQNRITAAAATARVKGQDPPEGQLSDADLCRALEQALLHAESVLSEERECPVNQQEVVFDTEGDLVH